MHAQLLNNPLLLTRFSQEEIEKFNVEQKGKNIFFGAGLVTSNQLSEAVPFDILGFFFTAEQLRRITGGEKVFVFVADQHARTNNMFPISTINQKTKEMMTVFKRINSNFGLDNFEVIRTMDLNKIPEIRQVFADLPPIENQYLKHEVADVQWLQKFHNLGVKLGWAMSVEKKVEGHDERFFDQTIEQFCPDISFIHLKPGRTFDNHRQRVSPYISVSGENRILLQPGEKAQEKLDTFKKTCSSDNFKATQRHLSGIVRLHETLFGPLQFMSLTEKLQAILDKAIQ